MPTPGIILTTATVTLQGRTILHDLNLTLTEPRIGIVGRNGSGKTTLLRLIAGLIPATTGRVTVDGIDPAGDRKAIVQKLGILFQNPDHQILFPTVIEEVAFGLRQLGLPDAETRALQTLTQHGRAHWAKTATHTLSQGQRHYLCLMSVLAMQPATILLDEPFAGMDLPTQTRLARAFDALPQRVITITHDPAVVEAYDRILWLEDGRIQADGPAAAVLASFRADMAMRGARDADTDIAG
jgi:biotin transport system ATP-binding protein